MRIPYIYSAPIFEFRFWAGEFTTTLPAVIKPQYFAFPEFFPTPNFQFVFYQNVRLEVWFWCNDVSSSQPSCETFLNNSHTRRTKVSYRLDIVANMAPSRPRTVAIHFKPLYDTFFVTVDKLSTQHEKVRQIENMGVKWRCVE